MTYDMYCFRAQRASETTFEFDFFRHRLVSSAPEGGRRYASSSSSTHAPGQLSASAALGLSSGSRARHAPISDANPGGCLGVTLRLTNAARDSRCAGVAGGDGAPYSLAKSRRTSAPQTQPPPASSARTPGTPPSI
jgi:hypothetical protein